MYDYLLHARSQSDIDKSMKYLKEDGKSDNWWHSKVESVSELLGIDIKTLDDGGFQFFQTESIQKGLEATGMDHCNGLLTPKIFKAPF